MQLLYPQVDTSLLQAGQFAVSSRQTWVFLTKQISSQCVSPK